jgi:hypothetical protein
LHAFDGDKIRHMTKIWNAGWALKELGVTPCGAGPIRQATPADPVKACQ